MAGRCGWECLVELGLEGLLLRLRLGLVGLVERVEMAGRVPPVRAPSAQQKRLGRWEWEEVGGPLPQ